MSEQDPTASASPATDEDGRPPAKRASPLHVAFVMVNHKYPGMKAFKDVLADAKLMSTVLEAAGYTVLFFENIKATFDDDHVTNNAATLRAQLKGVLREMRGKHGTRIVFYYTGPGGTEESDQVFRSVDNGYAFSAGQLLGMVADAACQECTAFCIFDFCNFAMARTRNGRNMPEPCEAKTVSTLRGEALVVTTSHANSHRFGTYDACVTSGLSRALAPHIQKNACAITAVLSAQRELTCGETYDSERRIGWFRSSFSRQHTF